VPPPAKAADGKHAFETELARFEAFDSAARGSVSVAALPVDGSTADNIIVGSGRSVGFGEMASFTPFDGGAGVTVATTGTTHGADLLVSGVSAKVKTAQVRKQRAGQALAASDQHGGQATRHGGVGCWVAAECARR